MNDYDDIDDMEYELPQAKSLQQSGRSVEEIKSMIKGSVCVYPCYFDRNSSNAKHNGTRRISKQLAIEEPSILYLVEAADILGLKGVVVEQQKRHPKDHFTFGRLRVPLKQQQSSSRSISITITSKEVLLRELAKKLPEAIQQLKLKFNNDAQFELQVIASRGRASPGLADMILNSGKPPGAASSGPGSSSSSASTPTTIATTAPSAASSSSTSSTTNKKKKKKK